MQVLLGVFFHFLGGFASGSFYIPYKKVSGWKWESYWLIGGLFSWLIVPPIAAWFTIPDFYQLIQSAGISSIIYTYFFGILWGIGGFTYGLGVRYLGVSLGSSIILGLCMIFGALIPAIYYEINPEANKDTISQLFTTQWGMIIIGGLILCIIAIIINAKAGIMKEKELNTSNPTKEYRFALGITVAIISGILSACFNFGLEAGKPLAEAANKIWQDTNNHRSSNYIFMNNITYVVILWGGLTTNLIGCIALNFRNKSFYNYVDKSTPILKNYLLCAIAGTAWFLQFFFYGMGESKIGNGASSWILHMAFIILTANCWGLFLKEWTGLNSKTRRTFIIGIFLIFVSVVIIGIGNALKTT